jgi:ubiquinone/menaquinone biosynthesis C-methylase UbiE
MKGMRTPAFDPDVFQFEYRSKRRPSQADDRIVSYMPAGCKCALDAACGSGRLSVRLAGSARFVYGLDLSTTMLTLAQQRYAAVPNVHWLRGRVQSLPFEAGTFDVVASINVLHLVDPEIGVPELRRVLKPGGRLVLCNWTADSTHSAARLQMLRTLRMAFEVYREFGLRDAWRFMTARKQRRRKEHANWYVALTPIAFSELAQRHLPGCELQQWRKTMVALWQRS